MGYRLTIDKHTEMARELVAKMSAEIGDELSSRPCSNADQSDEAGIYDQRERVAQLKEKLASIQSADALNLLSIADYLVKKSVWIVGGDGWAYDIGYGGLDHVLASGRNVNVLVLDTEVYSNTGGQASKSTPRAAVAKFAAGGKQAGRRTSACTPINYGNVYVATVAMGANDVQTVKAFLEAESYDGPSIIIAYSHCIAHGINMTDGHAAPEGGGQQRPLAAVPLSIPRLADQGKNPLIARFQAAQHPAEGLCLHGNALQDACPEPARRSQTSAGAGSEGCASALLPLPAAGQPEGRAGAGRSHATRSEGGRRLAECVWALQVGGVGSAPPE